MEEKTQLDGKYSERVQFPAKAIAEFIDRYVTLPFADMIQRASVKCRQSPESFDRHFHIPLPIVTNHKRGLPFHLGTFP